MKVEMSTVEVSKLAQDRGCILKVLPSDENPLYWVENQFFIGRPFRRLDDLVKFICLLPVTIMDQSTENITVCFNSAESPRSVQNG